MGAVKWESQMRECVLMKKCDKGSPAKFSIGTSHVPGSHEESNRQVGKQCTAMHNTWSKYKLPCTELQKVLDTLPSCVDCYGKKCHLGKWVKISMDTETTIMFIAAKVKARVYSQGVPAHILKTPSTKLEKEMRSGLKYDDKSMRKAVRWKAVHVRKRPHWYKERDLAFMIDKSTKGNEPINWANQDAKLKWRNHASQMHGKDTWHGLEAGKNKN